MEAEDLMSKLDTLLTKKTGKLLLLGNEAIVRGAFEGGVKVVTSYPGTPSSEIIDTFSRMSQKTGIYVEYSINEKVALEVAAGAAISGIRSLCSMKHVGLNVASDTFITLAYTGVRGGLVLVTADDPSCWSSQNEQDNRYYARLANVPMLEPANSQEAKDMTRYALELSEEIELPVLLRTTTRISHTLSPVNVGPLLKDGRKGRFIKDTERFVMVPRHALLMHEKLLEKMEKVHQISEVSPYNVIIQKGGQKIGIITSGAASNYALEAAQKISLEASVLKLGMTFPLPSQMISNFIRKRDIIIVIEELEPILENEVRSISSTLTTRPKIYGKLSGHFPRTKEYSISIVYNGVAKALGLPFLTEKENLKVVESSSAPPRPPVLCPGCPHRASFHILRTTLGKKIVYCTDIGCYALGIQPPLEVGDLLICMGASLGTASGINQVLGEPVVAIVGDSTFFHASIPALINAVYNNHKIVVVVLDNLTTAMTGFQPHPGVETLTSKKIVIEEVAQGCGIKYVKVVDPMNIAETRQVIKEAMTIKGPSVIVMRHPCSIYEKKMGKTYSPFKISPETCTNCLACVKTLGCPAIHIVEGNVTINEVLCAGCGLCSHICPYKAIKQ